MYLNRVVKAIVADSIEPITLTPIAANHVCVIIADHDLVHAYMIDAKIISQKRVGWLHRAPSCVVRCVLLVLRRMDG